MLGDYRIIEEIGAGGMGKVFLAENVHHRKRCAVKVLPEELSRDVNFRARFFDEARVMSDLNHAHIVHVHHMGEDHGIYYLVMDYVSSPSGKSRSIHGEMAGSPMRRIAPAKAHRWIVQVAEALAYAHGRGVIHRDIKPANILIDSEGNARITDFGLVKAIGKEFLLSQIHQTMRQTSASEGWPTSTGTVAGAGLQLPGVLHDFELAETTRQGPGQGYSGRSGPSGGGTGSRSSLFGTYDYMSPELLEGKEATEQSDVYSLGVMIYRMLTGRRPVGMAKPPSALVRGLSKNWDAVTAKCLADNVADRYSSVDELLKDLAKIEKRSVVPVVALVGVVLVIAVVALAWLSHLQRSTLDEAAWKDWGDAAVWMWPLKQASVEREADWSQDSELASLLKDLKICCVPFDKSPELGRAYGKAPDAAGIRVALDECKAGVAENRGVVSAINRMKEEVQSVRDFFFMSDADSRWGCLGRLTQERDALRAAGCSALADFLDLVLGKFDSDRFASGEDVAGAIDQVLNLTKAWPDVEYDKLDPNAVAADLPLQEKVQTDDELFSRIKELQKHIRLSGDESVAISKAINDLKQTRKTGGQVIDSARDQGMEDAAKWKSRLQSLDSQITAIESMPWTVGNKERIPEGCRELGQSIVDLDPRPWYVQNLERALNDCYGWEEELPWLQAKEAVTIKTLYDNWKSVRPPDGGQTGQAIAARVQMLEDIERTLEPDELIERLNDPNADVGAIWVAWRRLGNLPNRPWPQTREEWDQDTKVRGRLLNEPRLARFRQGIEDIGPEHEKTFRLFMIGQHVQAIQGKSAGDPFLQKVTQQRIANGQELTAITVWETATSELAGFVADDKWPGTYDFVTFYQSGEKGAQFLTKDALGANDLSDWQRALAEYPEGKSRPFTLSDTDPAIPIPDTPLRLELRRIEAKGRQFKMGVPARKWKDEKDPQEREVDLSRDFYIGKYEVTQAQYEAVMGGNPSVWKDDPNRPVENISWAQANEFCRRLSRDTGFGVRLPTEKEWEYACRAQRGKAGPEGNWPPNQDYCGGDKEDFLTRHGWCRIAHKYPSTEQKTRPIGTCSPNGFGLYDMHGNVWEWCSDEYGKAGDGERVIRGGAYDSKPEECRSAWRAGRAPDSPAGNIGFRVVVDIASSGVESGAEFPGQGD